MMRDVRSVAWLRWRQFRDGLVYWMRVMGYEPKGANLLDKLYPAYLLIIGLFWVFAMWAWGHDQAVVFGSNWPLDSLKSFLNAIPVAVFAVQVYVMVMALRSTPLKLSFADMAYLAAAPIERAAPVFLGFVRQVALRWLLFGALFALLAIAMTRLSDSGGSLSVSLRALFATLPLVIFTWALGWLLGILRLVYPGVARLPLLWLLPLLLIPLAQFFPQLVLWPGQALVLAIYGAAPIWLMPLLLLLAVALTTAFVWLGNRINMIRAVDESIIYARVQALGLLAWRQPDLLLRIRVQSGQAGRKPFLSLPRAQGPTLLLLRGLLSYVRHPFMLVANFLWGAAMALAGVLIVSNELPVQLWIGWLLVAGFAPPVGLLHVFRSDVEERFLRQFLPVNGFALLMADIVLPLLCLIAGALIVWLAQGFPAEIASLGVTFIPVLALLLALCGAVALTRQRVLQTRLLATAVSFGLVMVAGVNFAPIAAFVVAVLAIMTLGGMVAQEA